MKSSIPIALLILSAHSIVHPMQGLTKKGPKLSTIVHAPRPVIKPRTWGTWFRSFAANRPVAEPQQPVVTTQAAPQSYFNRFTSWLLGIRHAPVTPVPKIATPVSLALTEIQFTQTAENLIKNIRKKPRVGEEYKTLQSLRALRTLIEQNSRFINVLIPDQGIDKTLLTIMLEISPYIDIDTQEMDDFINGKATSRTDPTLIRIYQEEGLSEQLEKHRGPQVRLPQSHYMDNPLFSHETELAADALIRTILNLGGDLGPRSYDIYTNFIKKLRIITQFKKYYGFSMYASVRAGNLEMPEALFIETVLKQIATRNGLNYAQINAHITQTIDKAFELYKAYGLLDADSSTPLQILEKKRQEALDKLERETEIHPEKMNTAMDRVQAIERAFELIKNSKLEQTNKKLDYIGTRVDRALSRLATEEGRVELNRALERAVSGKGPEDF